MVYLFSLLLLLHYYLIYFVINILNWQIYYLHNIQYKSIFFSVKTFRRVSIYIYICTHFENSLGQPRSNERERLRKNWQLKLLLQSKRNISLVATLLDQIIWSINSYIYIERERLYSTYFQKHCSNNECHQWYYDLELSGD